MPKSRPPYPDQFRREALELVRQGRSIPDVAESLGVTAQSLRIGSVRTSAIVVRAMTG
jgi:transposase